MPDEPSQGSKLGAIAGIVIMIAFFLPWVRACNTELSGYQLATGDTGRVRVEEPGVYWLALAAGLICVGMFFLLRTDTAQSRIRAAVARLGVGLVGFLPLLNVWMNVKEQEERVEILYGGWLTGLGFLGVLVSFLIDLGTGEQLHVAAERPLPPPPEKRRPVRDAPPSSPEPAKKEKASPTTRPRLNQKEERVLELVSLGTGATCWRQGRKR